MTKKGMIIWAVALVAAPAVLAATVSGSIAARQTNFKALGKAFKALNDETRASAPSIVTIKANANALDAAAKKVGPNFPKGSGKESGFKTGASAAVWTKPAAFKAEAAKLQKATAALKAAAASGNLDKVKAAMPGVGGACKSCHDGFKIKE